MQSQTITASSRPRKEVCVETVELNEHTARWESFRWPFSDEGKALDGSNRTKWQERIGNAIPPPTADAIGGAMLRTLLMSQLGMAFCLSESDVWVRREQAEGVVLRLDR